MYEKTHPNQNFSVNNFSEFKIQMLNWAAQFNIFCFLDNHQYKFSNPSFECLLAAGCKKNIELSYKNAFEKLKQFYSIAKDQWLFGHLGYDLKNETELLTSANFDGIGFSDVHFFIPRIIIQLHKNRVTIYSDDDSAEEIYTSILASSKKIIKKETTIASINSRISKNEYINIIRKLQQHILQGDCYEVNFCQEFFAENARLDPLYIYHRLSEISPNPFSALYKKENKYCFCASPERYLKKSGNVIFSQPIKGTSKRDLYNEEQDEKSKRYLSESEKERTENVMIVDLVRNDLSRICLPGSVKVDELFGIYSFPQVHQMVSTISGYVKEGADWIDIIKATFPMGSMTGAPKKKVMELIEACEKTKRGLFSGSIGYIKPNGDFDFNVVIRSLFYNKKTKYLSFQAGSAITFCSQPEKEYEECVLKTAALLEVLK